MKIYIQSKSGNFNDYTSSESLELCWAIIRNMGGYYTRYQGKAIFVPLHEVEYIREAHDD